MPVESENSSGNVSTENETSADSGSADETLSSEDGGDSTSTDDTAAESVINDGSQAEVDPNNTESNDSGTVTENQTETND